MSVLLTVILPVFLVLGYGYVVAWRGWMAPPGVDGLMRFAQNFALPVLLFHSIARMDLGTQFDPVLLVSFYVGAFSSFAAGWAGGRWLFGRSPEDAVAIGFVCLFSNSLLLGVPITQRAYGDAAVAGNFAIIAMHSPLIYTFGITMMEFTRARGLNLSISRVAIARAWRRSAHAAGHRHPVRRWDEPGRPGRADDAGRLLGGGHADPQRGAADGAVRTGRGDLALSPTAATWA